MLEAIISFLPSEGNGAIGALDWTPEERRRLAAEVIINSTLITLDPLFLSLIIFLV